MTGRLISVGLAISNFSTFPDIALACCVSLNPRHVVERLLTSCSGPTEAIHAGTLVVRSASERMSIKLTSAPVALNAVRAFLQVSQFFKP